MSFKNVVEKYAGKLTEADNNLIQELMRNPQEASFLTASDLATRTGVHESTAIRLAQKLGFEGYPELRKALQQDLLDTVDSSERIQRRLEEANDLTVLVADEISAYHELLQSVSQSQIDQAAKILIDAEHVYLFARGHATALLEYVDRRLRRAGMYTIDLRHRGRDMAEHIINLNPKDALLAFAFRKKQRELETLLSQIKPEGVPSIVISDSLGPVIRPKPTLLISARRGAEGKFQSHSIPMTICSALILAIAKLDAGRTYESLEKLDELINIHGDPDSA